MPQVDYLMRDLVTRLASAPVVSATQTGPAQTRGAVAKDRTADVVAAGAASPIDNPNPALKLKPLSLMTKAALQT